MSGSTLTDALRETLALFEESGPPLTTNEVADRLDLGRRSSYDRLERLAEHGRLETKKVGANARVWWRPADGSTRVGTEGSGEWSLGSGGEQLRLLVEAVEDYAIFMLDPDGRVRTWNPGAERIKGYEREEIVGEHFSTFYTEEDREAGVPGDNLAKAAADGVATDEGWRRRADGSRFWAHVTITAVYDEDDDLVGFGKVTRDLTERHERERAVERERAMLDQVLETSPIGIGVFRRDGSVDRINARMGELLWLADDEADEYTLGDADVRDPSGEPLSPSDTPAGRALETGETATGEELLVVDPERGTRWLSVDAAPLAGEGDEVRSVVVTATDITRHKEQARRLERQRDELVSELDEMYERIDDAFYALDDEFRFSYVNEQAAELLRREEGELLGESVWEVFPEAKETPAWERFHRSLEEQVTTSFELYFEPLDIWAEANVYPSETGLSVYFRDVSERKERERELERYETIVETMVDGVFVTDEDGEFAMVNDAYVEMTGYSRDELIGSDTSLVIGEENAEEGLEMIEEILEGEREVGVWELTQQRADGGTNLVESRFTPLPNDGEYRGSVGVVRDISERKERERQLEEYERIVETVDDGVYLVDEDLRIQLVNDAYTEITGYSREELLGAHISKVVDTDVVDFTRERREELVAGAPGGTAEVPLQTATGETITVEARYVPLLEEDEAFRGTVGVVRDVTERKERERELERYERIVETVDDGVYLVNPDGEFIMVNEAYAAMTGYPREEIIGMSVGELVDEETVERALRYEEEMVEGELETARFEADVIRADGDTFRGEGVFSIIEGDDGEHIRVGVVRDVTERKERERELERYETAVGTASDVIVTIDEGSTIRDVNPAVADVFGYEPAQLVGESLTELMPERMRERHVEARDRYLETGEARLDWDYVELPGVHREGHEMPLAISFGEFEFDGERFFTGIIRDNTERKERERERERQHERLAALNDLNGVVRDITDAVIDGSTREEIERAVCSGLADADSYEFAWIGDVDPATETMRLRTEAGVVGYLEDVTISVDPEDPRGQGPTGRAVRTNRMQTSDDAFEDATYDAWREQARELGFRSSAAIPLVHEDVRYGVLNLYADRPNAFTGDEEEVVEHLGEVVGHAIAAVERKRALTSDEVVELAFQIQGVFDAFDLPEGDGRITLDRAVPVGDGTYLEYGTASGDMLDVLDELVETLPHWKLLRVLGEPSDGGPVTFELELDDPPVLSTVTALGGYVDQAIIEDADYQMRIHLAPSADARSLIEHVQETYPMAQLVSRRQVTRDADSPMPLLGMLDEHLTERQRAALEAAYFAGYFEWPRAVNGEDVADSLGVSAPTFHQHLRKAQQKLLRVALDRGAAD